MVRYKLLPVLLLFFLVQACQKSDCVLISGEEKVLNEPLGFFDGITLEGVFDVYLYQDRLSSIYVEAPENILQNIVYEVEDSILHVYNYNSCTWSSDYERIQVHLTFKDIDKLMVGSSCKIFSVDTITSNMLIGITGQYAEINIVFRNNNFYFYNNYNSKGIFTFSGYTAYPFLGAYGGAKIDAASLTSEIVAVENISIAPIFAGTTKLLIARPLSDAFIYYTGKPDSISVTPSEKAHLVLPRP